MIRNKKGVTIVELLAVIIIMGIIAIIAVPTIGNLIDNQRQKAAVLTGNVAMESLRLYYLDNPITDDTSVTYDCELTMDSDLTNHLSGYMSEVPDIKGVSITVSPNGNISIVDTSADDDETINGELVDIDSSNTGIFIVD